jgi:hypothetical protein
LVQSLQLLVDDVDHVRRDFATKGISLRQIQLQLLRVLNLLHSVVLSLVDHLANLCEILLYVLRDLLRGCLRLDCLHLVLDVVELFEVPVHGVADLARLLGNEGGFLVVALEQALLAQEGAGFGDVGGKRLVLMHQTV